MKDGLWRTIWQRIITIEREIDILISFEHLEGVSIAKSYDLLEILLESLKSKILNIFKEEIMKKNVM